MRHPGGVTTKVGDYLARNVRPAFVMDWSNVRTVSAVRSTLVVALAYLLVATWTGPPDARKAVFGALFAAFLDRSDTPVWVSARGALGMSGAVFVVLLITGLVSPWPAAAALVVVLVAAGAGIASAHSMTAARVVAFTAAMALIDVFLPATPAQALRSAAFVTLGVAAQGLAMLLAALLTGDSVERYRTARALRAVAALCDRARASDRDLAGIREEVALRLAAAEQLATGGGVGPAEEARLLDVLAGAQACRAEALSYFRRLGPPHTPGVADARSQAGSPPAAPDRVAALSAASAALMASAATLTAQFWGRRSRASRMAEAIRRLRTHAVPTSPLAHACDLLARAGQRPPHRPRMRPHHTRPTVRSEVRAALASPTLPRRHAARLMVGTATGCAVAWALGLAEPAWIPMTVVLVLRPDIPSTTIRVILRGAGTVVGAVLVTGLVTVLPGDGPWLLACAVVLTLGMYAVMTVNYSIFVMSIVPVVIVLNASTSAQAPQLAIDRLVNVFLGCVVALAVSWLIPVWMTDQLPSLLDRYTRAVADWFTLIAGAAAAGSVALEREARLSRAQRAAYQAAIKALAVARSEPRSPDVDPERASALLIAVRQSLRSGQECVAPITQRGAGSTSAAMSAASCAATLRMVAARCRQPGSLGWTDTSPDLGDVESDGGVPAMRIAGEPSGMSLETTMAEAHVRAVAAMDLVAEPSDEDAIPGHR